MSTVSLRLDEALHDKARELAQAEGVTVDQFITEALAEKIWAVMTANYLEERAERDDHAKFERAVGNLSDLVPD